MSEAEEETFKAVELGNQEASGELGNQEASGASEAEEETFKAVELGNQEASGASEAHLASPQCPPSEEEEGHPETQTPEKGQGGQGEEKGPALPPGAGAKDNRWMSALDQFKLKRFFVLRPGTLNQAIEDIKSVAVQVEDGSVNSIWLMAEVDHWNNEKERVVLITDNTLLVCKYDFVMFICEQVQRIPLNFVDRVSHGNFSFPQRSLLTREGQGVRVFWDRLREPSFSSRWNPFATDYPYITFTYHPVRNVNDKFAALCEIQNFREQLTEAAQKAHAMKPVPGKANGVLVLNQPVVVEAYVGLMSTIGNQNKLGYCLARGNIGF